MQLLIRVEKLHCMSDAAKGDQVGSLGLYSDITIFQNMWMKRASDGLWRKTDHQ